VRRRRIGTVVADRSALSLTKIALVFTALSELPQGTHLSGIEEILAESCQTLPFGTNHDVQEDARCLERAAADCSAMICYPTGALDNTLLLRKIADSLPLIFVGRLPEVAYYERAEIVLPQALSQPEPVTAVAWEQDSTMAAILEACIHLGLCVPDDLTTLSFSDMLSISQPLVYSVLRLVQRPVEMGNMAAGVTRCAWPPSTCRHS
jgi:DNA-binding LacI/PurR family transcriptional regulator